MRDLVQLQADSVAALIRQLSLDRDEARTDVRMMLQQVLGVSRAWLMAHPESSLDTQQQARYEESLARRLSGEPLAYILGEREFYSLRFKVTPATLIPRPDTETLVDLALSHLPPGGRVLDMGTGSGAIAISIAHTRHDAAVTALDVSPDALAVALENARRLAVGNVAFVESDWFSAVAGSRFDLIVSNPPYIAEGDRHLDGLRFEPSSALTSGKDGLDDIRRIVSEAPRHLEPDGWLMLEHGYDQAEAVRDLLVRSGFEGTGSVADLSGVERVSYGRLG